MNSLSLIEGENTGKEKDESIQGVELLESDPCDSNSTFFKEAEAFSSQIQTLIHSFQVQFDLQIQNHSFHSLTVQESLLSETEGIIHENLLRTVILN